MSKSVIIPSNTKPMWECCINGKWYSYTAGSTQTVPDEVAAVVENYNASQPKEAVVVYDEGICYRNSDGSITPLKFDKDAGICVADANGNIKTTETVGDKLLCTAHNGAIQFKTFSEMKQSLQDDLFATVDNIGVVYACDKVANATSTSDVVTKFNGLLAAMQSAGIMADE